MMSEDTLICPLCGEAITVQGHTCGVVRGGGVLQLMDVGDYITKRLADLPFLVGRINQLEQAFLKLTTMHDNVACLACELAEALDRAARALDWDAPREHQMLNASINRLRVTFSPPALAMVDWGDVAHLSESRDETLT